MNVLLNGCVTCATLNVIIFHASRISRQFSVRFYSDLFKEVDLVHVHLVKNNTDSSSPLPRAHCFMPRSKQLGTLKNTRSNHDVSDLQVGKSEL